MKLLNNMFFAIVFLFLFSSDSQAACGESKNICYHYRGNNLISKSSCEITECANISGGLQNWDWKDKEVYIEVYDGQIMVNGKSGFSVEKGELFCYGIKSNRDELFCSKQK